MQNIVSMSRPTILLKNSVQIGCNNDSGEEKRMNETMPSSMEECFLLRITLRMLLARLVRSESVLYKSSWYAYSKQPFDVDDGLIFDAWSDPNDCVHSTMNETPDDTTEAV